MSQEITGIPIRENHLLYREASYICQILNINPPRLFSSEDFIVLEGGIIVVGYTCDPELNDNQLKAIIVVNSMLDERAIIGNLAHEMIHCYHYTIDGTCRGEVGMGSRKNAEEIEADGFAIAYLAHKYNNNVISKELAELMFIEEYDNSDRESRINSAKEMLDKYFTKKQSVFERFKNAFFRK